MKEFGLNFTLTFLILLLLAMISPLIEGGIKGAGFYMLLFLLPVITMMSLVNAIYLAIIDVFVINIKNKIIFTFLPTLVTILFLLINMATSTTKNYSSSNLFFFFSIVTAVFISNFLRYKRITKI